LLVKFVNSLQDFKDKDTDARLHIKGQLLYVEEWKMMIFLGCPFIHNLKTMIENGLFISDMSTHGTIRTGLNHIKLLGAYLGT
jgi:hypothetical protein